MKRPHGTHNKESLDREKLRPDVRRWLEHLETLVIPPKNGKEYNSKSSPYHLKEDVTVRLNERQVNYAKLLSKDVLTPIEKYVAAGYNFYSAFAPNKGKGRTKRGIRATLEGRVESHTKPEVTALANFLRYEGAKELQVDATWLLNEQVSLYRECREKKQYTQAVRLLHDISYHVDVDARVSNKIEIEQKVDYASILGEADKRVIEHKPDNVVELGVVNENV